jgi:AraC family transcriptional regulator
MITKEEVLRREYAGRISRAVEMVYRCFGDDIGPDEMADAACFSRYHFHRVFHGMTGEGPAEFIRRIRLERAACFLMDNPSRPATDIALACGFSSPSVFARAFKERFGSSATEYRQARYS